MRYALAIFDFDGTLVDSLPVIARVANGALAAHGLPARSVEDVRPLVGLPLGDVLATLGGLADRDDSSALCDTYRELWDDTRPAPLFQGVREMLSRVRDAGTRLAVATSRKREGLSTMLGVHEIAGLFEFLVGGACTVERKPHPAPVHRTLDRLGVTAEESIVIGDTTFDLDMGTAAGTATCAVTWGNHGRTTLVSRNPTFVVSAARQVVDVVCG